MSIAARKGHKDITMLIAGMDNYNPFIENINGMNDLIWLNICRCAETLDIHNKKYPDIQNSKIIQL